MTDDEFEKELEDLTEMLRSLRLIKDKGHKRRFRAVILASVNRLIK